MLAIGISLVSFAALRLVFLAVFRDLAGAAPAQDLLQALYIGLKFDLRLAVLAAAPVALLGWIAPLSPARPRAAALWSGYLALAQVLLLLLYAVDFGYYAYTRTRLNSSVLELLTPVDVAARMVWQTYPVLWGLLALALAGIVYFVLLRWLAPRPPATYRRWARFAAAAAVVCLGVAAIWGKASWYPLRWSDAYFSNNDFVSALALNPPLFLLDTLGEAAEPVQIATVRENYAMVADLLEVKDRDARDLSFKRYVKPGRSAARQDEAPLNLVVIHLESLAGFKVGALGSRSGATPHFDKLAAEGLLFTNFFVPAVPTARSVFTMLTGAPDYRGGRAASRDPLMAKQHTLVNALSGYERFYFLGGSASWGNIRSLLSQSIEGLQVYEEGDYGDAARADVWGITDHDLFENANAALKATKAPFFAFIQTSGNHRPYTIPENNRHGFELASRDGASLHAEGFDSLAAYNGLRFMDHAIGHFFELARREPYFRNTVFILYGDHGNPAANDTPWQQLGLNSFHVPMLIYSPRRVAAGRRDIVASLVDVLPTALGIMGVPYLNQTLGRDLMVARAPERRFALIPEGLLTDEFLLREIPAGGVQLYRYRSAEPAAELRGSLPGKAQELQRLREALYETARYMLYHNKPGRHSPPGESTAAQ